jgi:response regulator of citrate/malate metabolism
MELITIKDYAKASNLRLLKVYRYVRKARLEAKGLLKSGKVHAFLYAKQDLDALEFTYTKKVKEKPAKVKKVKEVKQYIRPENSFTIKEFAQRLGVHRTIVERRIDPLTSNGYVQVHKALARTYRESDLLLACGSLEGTSKLTQKGE